MIRRRTVVIGSLATLALATGAVVGIGSLGDEPASATETAAPIATEEISRRTMVRSAEVDGMLGFGDAVPVSVAAPGTVTWLPEVGTGVDRGAVVARVDNGPVVALIGALPLYRSLGSGATGADVRQLEENLAALGYDGFTVDDTFTAKTAAAVRAWQKDLGLKRTGEVTSDWTVVLPEAGRVQAVSARVGDPSGGPVLTTTGTDRLVKVDVPIAKQELAVVGQQVEVKLPGGVATTGTITDVGSPVVSEAPMGEKPDLTKATVTTTIRIDDVAALAGLDVSAVTVSFRAEEREGVLAVPVAALLALEGGGYGVEVAASGTTRIVPVETGLFADGQVEVTAKGDGTLAEGDEVVVPS